VRAHRFAPAPHSEICAFAHGPAHAGRGVITAVNTSALQWHRTNAVAGHALGSFGDHEQGGKVGMPAIEVWGARGRERVIALEEASYVVGRQGISINTKNHVPLVGKRTS